LGGLCQTSAFGLVPPFPVAGRPFWPDLLNATGVDVSFLKVLPGDAAPFAMRHRRNEVVYVVASGRGQFRIDGQAIDVAEGTVLRVHPNVVRAWRNVSSEDLLLIVVQGRNDSRRRPTRSDAIGLAGLIPWWRHPWSRPRSADAPPGPGDE
jgi:mannose-6-phosphate isomerase-like protein (cupin superfamily)